MTYETAPDILGSEAEIAERLNEFMTNELDYDPDDYLIEAHGGGEFDLTVHKNIGVME